MEGTIETGDGVFHKSSGERWVVACVIGDYLYWCGWPAGRAVVEDCELYQKASPEYREEILRQLAKMLEPNDIRCRYAFDVLTARGTAVA